MNTNFSVIGLTRLGIKPESTVSEADTLTTRPPELLNSSNHDVLTVLNLNNHNNKAVNTELTIL